MRAGRELPLARTSGGRSLVGGGEGPQYPAQVGRGGREADHPVPVAQFGDVPALRHGVAVAAAWTADRPDDEPLHRDRACREAARARVGRDGGPVGAEDDVGAEAVGVVVRGFQEPGGQEDVLVVQGVPSGVPGGRTRVARQARTTRASEASDPRPAQTTSPMVSGIRVGCW